MVYGEANLSRGCFASCSTTLCIKTALGQEKCGFCPVAGQGEEPGEPLRIIISPGSTAGTWKTKRPTKQGKDRLPTLFSAFPSLHNQPPAPLCPVQNTAREKPLHESNTCTRETPAQQRCTTAGRRAKKSQSLVMSLRMDGPSSASSF